MKAKAEELHRSGPVLGVMRLWLYSRVELLGERMKAIETLSSCSEARKSKGSRDGAVSFTGPGVEEGKQRERK